MVRKGQATTRKEILEKRKRIKIETLQKRIDNGEKWKDIPDRGLVRMSASNTKVMLGLDDLSDWDDEELRAGRRRGKNGLLIGRQPKILPKALHDELVKRTLSRAHIELRDNLEAAVKSLTSIATDTTVEAKDRVKAIGMIMDRVMGKAPERVQITGETPKWLETLSAAIISKSEEFVEDESHIIDAVLVDEDEEAS